MRVVLFGATGMVGQGVLHECLADPRVTAVLAVGRTPVPREHPKLRQRVVPDLADLTAVADDLAGCDACFFCLGVTSLGLSERAYRRVTYDLTMHVARLLAAGSPDAVLVYVSGAGTDPAGSRMWARVRGATENALRTLRLRVYLFRPAYIQPRGGVLSRTRWYRLAYRAAGPLYPALRRLAPGAVTASDTVGRAMIAVAAAGWPTDVLRTRDINAAGDVGAARR
ncbi:epimerase [Pilimelia terevasa]|uniref:Epimerase n=1 Tax=Pilimelia terevasa TaxID=53372 RepID=A0A8J3FLX4_9ACTN|nr:NAD(P)H-binding protein [Pilimelia terevasa]GGK40007.1 epimerase [Pilimelia terevasa]